MKQPNRRSVLRGMGACLALPLFESVAGASAFEAAPKRLLFVYVPNGVHLRDWRLPTRSGEASSPLPKKLPKTLREIERHRDRFVALSGLTLDKARNNGDGPGDHARAAGAFLTCTQPVKADGTILGVGISADQVAARSIGGDTRFRSLQLACEGGRQSGQCDSGYPCAYSSNISWSTPHTPLIPEIYPRALFDRLFGVGLAHLDPEERARRIRLRKSVLDFVRKDAKDLEGRLGSQDQRKLDEYLTGIRELELRIDRSEDPVAVEMERPGSTPPDYEEHASMMFELLALAFATDSTRVASFMMANEGSGRTYGQLGAREGHHSLSHHGGDADKQEIIAAINRFHLGLFGGFLDRLANFEEGGESLLDRSLIVYGSGIADGDAHGHHALPILLAGGGSEVPTGHHLSFPKETPIANLYLKLFEWMGVQKAAGAGPLGRFGDSTGVLSV